MRIDSESNNFLSAEKQVLFYVLVQETMKDKCKEKR